MNVKYAHLTKSSHVNYAYRFSLFHLFRPLTLSGTISPILAATALVTLKGTIQWNIFFAILFASLFVQIAINIYNDYFDFKNGQDQDKWTKSSDHPFKLTPSHHQLPFIASGLLTMSAILGIWLAIQSSFWIIFVGIISIIFGYAYSAGSQSLSAIGLGEVVAAVFLGIVVPLLAYFVQGNQLNSQILAVSIPFSMLISSMILTNNLRDMDKDMGFRRTLVIVFGRVWANRLLTVLLMGAYLWVMALVLFNMIPWTSIIVLLAIPLAVRLRWSFRKDAKRIDEIKAMKLAALHHWAFGILFAIGIWLPF